MAVAKKNEVAVVEDNDRAQMLAELGLDVDELDALKREAIGALDISKDVRLPALMMVQSNTDVDAKKGSLYHSISGESWSDVQVVVIRTWKTRRMFSSEIGKPPLCSSPNSEDGYGVQAEELIAQGKTGPRGNSGACRVCPQASYQNGGTCKIVYNYLAILLGPTDREEDMDLEVMMPVVFSMQSTSAKVASRLNALLLNARYPWDVIINLKTEATENAKGKFFLWNVSKGGDSTDAQQLAALRHLKAIHERIKAGADIVTDGEVVDEEATPTGNAPVGDGDIPF